MPGKGRMKGQQMAQDEQFAPSLKDLRQRRHPARVVSDVETRTYSEVSFVSFSHVVGRKPARCSAEMHKVVAESLALKKPGACMDKQTVLLKMVFAGVGLEAGASDQCPSKGA